MSLAERLHRPRRRVLLVADVDRQLPSSHAAAEEFGATVVSALDEIHAVECDIFAPCALGADLNPETDSRSWRAPRSPVRQTISSCPSAGRGCTWQQRGILYAPGLRRERRRESSTSLLRRVATTPRDGRRSWWIRIYENLTEIFRDRPICSMSMGTEPRRRREWQIDRTGGQGRKEKQEHDTEPGQRDRP